MRADRIVAGVAGLAVGFGVLLVTVDVADTDAADGSPPTSTTVEDLVATSTSTAITTTTSTTTTTAHPTTTTARPTTTTARPTTTTARPTTTTATLPDRTRQGFEEFDPRCIGLDLGNDALMTASEDELRVVMRKRVVDDVRFRGELSESDASELADAVEELDWTRCAQVVVKLDSDDRDDWLCLFGSLVETSESLLDWMVGEGICLNEPTPGVPTGNSGPSVDIANDNSEGPG